MKRLFFITVTVFMMCWSLSASDINLGDFPIGKWLDSNYNAVWDFSSGSIKITALDGSVYFDFSQNTVKGFGVTVTRDGPAITFSCDESGRSYTITKTLLDTDVILEIDRPGKEHYKVQMKKQ